MSDAGAASFADASSALVELLLLSPLGERGGLTDAGLCSVAGITSLRRLEVQLHMPSDT